MAARRGVELNDEHRRRVAEGEIGLSALAGELGVSRQTIFAAFKRRDWLTTAAPAALHQAEKPKIDARATKKPARRQGLSKAPNCQPAPNCALAASAAPAAALPVVTAAELAEHARQQVAGVALLALAQLQDQLTSQRLGPGAVKAATQAAQGAADLLQRAGILIDDEASQEAPRMIFEELTAAECATICAQAEVEHGGMFIPDDERDDSDQSDDQ